MGVVKWRQLQDTNQIQAQIEVLQAQQRKIQAYLQQLGSVESQMVSASQMISEAVASIREFCPDELASYQETINSLFGDSPIAQLSASVDNQPEVEVTPNQPLDSDSTSIDIDSVVVDDIHIDQVNSDILATDGLVNGNGSNGNCHTKQADITNYDLITPKSELAKLPRPQLIKLANKYKVQNYMSMTANKLTAALAGKVKQSDIEQLLTKSGK